MIVLLVFPAMPSEFVYPRVMAGTPAPVSPDTPIAMFTPIPVVPPASSRAGQDGEVINCKAVEVILIPPLCHKRSHRRMAPIWLAPQMNLDNRASRMPVGLSNGI